ncbi:PolC-type DNA polymerase III [Lagierella sp.]|uniref:PolC-type DNA polymerase III n=1 Tax=Lagierella sp. TaxID=2849657 RepID=UPI0026105BAF|nr:PolC-type DNA polymerase III [Lagierella sp.]
MNLIELGSKFGYNFNLKEELEVKQVKYSKYFDKVEILLSGNVDDNSRESITSFFNEVLNGISTIEINYLQHDSESVSFEDISKLCLTFFSKEGFDRDDIKIFCINEILTITLPQIANAPKLEELELKLSKLLQDNNVEINSMNISYENLDDTTEDFIEGLKSQEKKIAKVAVDRIEKKEMEQVKAKDDSKKESFGRKIKNTVTKISELGDSWDFVCVAGEVLDCSEVRTKNDKYIILTYDIYDNTSSVTCKTFFQSDKYEEYSDIVKPGKCIKVEGKYSYDNFSRSNIINVNSIEVYKMSKREDKAKDKRVELHLFSQYSAIDGFIKIDEFIQQLEEWGYSAIGVTDKGVAQGFPEISEAVNGKNIRALYGIEGKILKDNLRVVTDFHKTFNNDSFVVFDIETTGFSKVRDRIIEIGAVKVKDGKIVDEFNQLINPNVQLPQKIIEITNITDSMLIDKPTIDKVLPEFMDFVSDATLVAHNAEFDIGFIRENCKREKIEFVNAYLDTLALCRGVFPNLKNHKLDTISKHLNVSLENHHRACDDAMATAQIFIKTLEEETICEIKDLTELNYIKTTWPKYKNESYNSVIYAKNLTGLKNLYKLISISSMEYFNNSPGIPENLLQKYREGLIIGSGNFKGELFQSIISGYPTDHINKVMEQYDFIEIQPPLNYRPLVDSGKIESMQKVEMILMEVIVRAKEIGKLVVATSDCHYFEPKDYILRNIVQSAQPFVRRENIEKYPTLYFRTTDEMLREFSFLSEELRREVVIENTYKIRDMIEDFKPIPDGTFPPVIEGSDKTLKDITYNRAKALYGDPIPEYVKSRLDKELNSIISNGYAVLYIIAQKLVKKSNDDGYLVGSRGSVGSSFAATMAGITEVNPLLPHYRCGECKYSRFIDDMNIGSGLDLPDEKCPVCGADLIKDGHNIPFEVFLGFEGDKEPDIDLNFAGEYQPICHKYTEELFGEDKVFRAGTIGTIAENTAYGYVKKYMEMTDASFSQAEIKRLQKKLVGVKRTSGQHPGGVMIVPKDKEIYDFCPVQHPADDMNSDIITTHFNYKAISGRILKLDLLGHDVPSIIRHLQDITGVDPLNVPFDDEKTMSLFNSTDALKFKVPYDNSQVGTLGIPEFGTNFVRQMLIETNPTNISELFRISGLSHGTDVWTNNAQELVKNGITTLKNVISTRDDIMTYLIQKGLEKKRSFTIMERVRKGRDLDDETEDYMRSFDVPEWYIDSCRKIKYMFPKAHAVAYVLMSYRIAYFKVHYPEAFYCTYFTTKNDCFPGQIVFSGLEAIRNEMEDIRQKGYGATAKEKNILTVLELAEEMYCRGIKMDPVQFHKSLDLNFTYDKKGSIIPPFRALEGVSDAHSISIYNEVLKGDFISIQDLISRTGINKVAVQALKEHGTLSGMSESNQISLF